MIFEAKAVDKDTIATDFERQPIQSLPEQPQDIVVLFATIVDSDSFFGVADNILTRVRDARCLAECGQLARRREPGGAYYGARFWAKSAEAIDNAAQNEKEQRQQFLMVCKETGVSTGTAKIYVEQGKAIKTAEYAIPNKALRKAPLAVFDNAKQQKEKAVQYLIKAAVLLDLNPDATPRQIHSNWCDFHGSIKSNLDIIKPSDWWAFSHPKWRQEENFPGSIPGEIYANALYYFAPRTGIAVDAMAGSGMLQRVYEDRERWQKDMQFDLDIHLFDLHPRRDFIQHHDARNPLPIEADWIFIDPPYFGQSTHLYSGDLALTANYSEYLQILNEVVKGLAASLNPKGRLCLFLPKWSGLKPEDANHNIPADISAFAVSAGLEWIDAAFVSRGRQQEPGSAAKNNSAKRIRRMRSDTCILNVFQKA